MSAEWKNMELLSAGNHAFTCYLYKQVLEENSQANLFFSPFSLYTALSMTLVGARGETAKQILKCLGIKEQDFDLHSVLPEMLISLRNVGTTDITNALFIQKHFSANPSFVETLEKSYRAVIKSVDFVQEPDQAVVLVNNWVNDSTSGKISKLVERLDSNTVMVILNAVYFKSFWAQRFNPSYTDDAQFHINGSKRIDVKLMFQSGKFRLAYNELASCDILELPYQDKQTSMLIFLPREVEGLNNVESLFNPDFLKEVFDKFGSSKHVDVYLPSFKLEQSLSLKSVLTKLGMSDLFSVGKANLAGISDNANLYVSEVVHKSYVDVNEEGTEAAAVSGVIAANYCARFNATFRADHPFLFCILENKSKSILFAGSLKDPSAC